MDAKALFFRNLSTAITKRFPVSPSLISKPKKEVVRTLIDKHFSDIEPPRAEKTSPRPIIAEEPKKISPSRAKEIEEKVKQAVDPELIAKRKVATFLSDKIAELEKKLETESMPKYDRERLRAIIAGKKDELLAYRATL